MKKNVILTVVILLMAVVTAVQAEVRAGSISVTPFIGGYAFEGNEYDLKTTYTAGLRAGYNFTKNIGVEGFFNYVPTEVKDTVDADVKLYGYGIEGIFHFMPESRFVPFLAIGIGGIHYSTPADVSEMNKFTVDYGAGLKIFLTDNIALRGDVRHVIPLNDRYNDLLVTFGICFSFGGEKKIIAEKRAVESVAPKVEEPAAQKEIVVAPKIEEPIAPKEAAAAAKVEEPVAPKEAVAVAPAPAVTESLAPVSNEKNEIKAIPEEDIRNLINKWLASWQSGDMETYRGFYASDFQSKGMNLNSWISYKTNAREKSNNIIIRIEDLKISVDAKTAVATAIFTQYYSSSIIKNTLKKTLNLRKINNEWKIYKETIAPLK